MGRKGHLACGSLVYGERCAGVRGDLDEDAARLADVDRLEVVPVDDGRGIEACVGDALAPRPDRVAIAAVKASLVVLFFMHLKYDNPVNALTFTIGTIFVVVFVAITLLDTAFRGDLGNVNPRTVQEIQAEQERAQEGQDAIPAESLRIAPGDYSGQNRGASLPSDGGS